MIREDHERPAGLKVPNKPLGRVARSTLELSAILFSVYVVAQVFLLDVARALLNTVAPDWAWLAEAKLVFFLCMFALPFLSLP